MSANNQDGIFEEMHWARFDALPPEFRRALRYCSHSMTVGWVEDLIANFGEEKALVLVKRSLAEMRRATIIKHYGVNHPQLGFKS